MKTYYYLLSIVFFIIASMMILDNNVSLYIILLTKIVKLKCERLIWLIRFHPFWYTNPVSKWMKYREYEKRSKELLEEFSKDSK